MSYEMPDAFCNVITAQVYSVSYTIYRSVPVYDISRVRLQDRGERGLACIRGGLLDWSHLMPCFSSNIWTEYNFFAGQARVCYTCSENTHDSFPVEKEW